MNVLKNAPIIRVYALALLNKISKLSKSDLKAFVDGVDTLSGFLKKNPDFLSYLCNAPLDKSQYGKIIESLCVSSGLPNMIIEFADFLYQKRRFDVFPEVLRLSLCHLRVQEGVVGVHIFSSVPLENLQRTQIKDFLQLKLRQKVEILSEEKLFQGYGILLKTELGGVFDWSTRALINKLRIKWLDEEFPLPILA